MPRAYLLLNDAQGPRLPMKIFKLALRSGHAYIIASTPTHTNGMQLHIHALISMAVYQSRRYNKGKYG